MSADNFNYVRLVDGWWHVWLNLCASSDVDGQLEDTLRTKKSDRQFLTADDARRWADAQGYVEYGTQIDDRTPRDVLLVLLRESLSLRKKMQQAIDAVLTPTTTGYLHSSQSWTITGVREGEYGTELELLIEPPSGAFPWQWVTVERLNDLKRRLGCDRVSGFGVENGKIRYTASYHRKDPT